jgi:hypothetical protein
MSTTARKQLDTLKRRLVPPAVVPLIEVYTSDNRKWNSNHRTSAQDQLLQAVREAETIDALREWILAQRYSGVLVEVWFAFRCFRFAADAVLPEDDLQTARLVIEAYVRDFYRVA